MKIDLEKCVIKLDAKERISDELAAVLEPVDIGGIHHFRIPVTRPTELHYHENDEYWLFARGETVVTLRREDGTEKAFEIGPNTLIVTPRGIEHGHVPGTDVEGFEWSSVIRAGAKRGHLQR